jgi:hypothetical protein
MVILHERAKVTEECNILVTLTKKKKKKKKTEEVEEVQEEEEEKGEEKDIYIQVENILHEVMKISVFWDIMTFSPLTVNRHFGITYHLHLQGPTYKKSIMKDGWNVGHQITVATEDSKPMNV